MDNRASRLARNGWTQVGHPCTQPSAVRQEVLADNGASQPPPGTCGSIPLRSDLISRTASPLRLKEEGRRAIRPGAGQDRRANSRGRISRRLQLDSFVPAVQERGDQRADVVRTVQKDEMPTAFDCV